MAKNSLLAVWEEGDWDAVLSASESSLVGAPLDPFYLTFKGFAAFYKAMELPEGEERIALLDESVGSLRKALVASGAGGSGRIPKAQIEYVLGKAYFQKGTVYFDSAARFIEASILDGSTATDSREYLALAYSGLGEKAKALENFEAALNRERRAVLLIAAAKARLEAGDASGAESLLLEAQERGGDALAEERSRFMLGEIYASRGDFDKAGRQFALILEKNPDSAEAHFRLGLIFQEQGDLVRARSEWRRAVAIDPMHLPSRQKLSEKI